MTKNERIKQLEDKIEALEARIAMLEAGVGYVSGMQPWYAPIVDNYCTCGTSAVCPLHGMNISWSGDTVAANMGYKS